MRAVVLAMLVGCAPAVVPRHVVDAPVMPVEREATRQYTIWLGGARVGTAREIEAWSVDGVELTRTETLTYLRGDTPVELITTIAVTANSRLEPTRVTWTERGGAGERSAEAMRDGKSWRVIGDASVRTLPAGAIPAELVPLRVARDHHFEAPVFLPARGFILGAGRVEPVAPGRLVARLAIANGAQAEATIDTAEDGSYVRVVDGEGVIEIAATRTEAAARFPLVDLLAATAIPIAGGGAGPITLLGNVALPAVPGQAARESDAGDGLTLELSPALPGHLPEDAPSADRSAEIELLVSLVREQITPDLATGTATTADAAAATAGDCTTFALAYAAHARERDIPTRLVTGLRVDGDHLVRHRWAVSWTGVAWIAVDAAYGAAPAGGNLIGLAVHDADDAGLVAGEAALAAVHGARR